MSATDAPHAPLATAGTGLGRGDVHGAKLLFVDMRLRSLVIGEARRGVVTRVFGVPRADQSFLATMILVGAVAAVLRDVTPRPWPHATGADVRIGASLLNAAFRGIAGPPSRSIPLAGGLVAFAVLSHSVRPVVAGSAGEIRALGRAARAAFGARYGH